MRKIEITTSQNVTIQYELATIIQRIVATIIDFIAIFLFCLFFFVIFFENWEFAFEAYIIYALMFASFFYHLLFETFNHGQSLGKKIFKIRVIKINGERPGFFDFMIRTAFRIVDIPLSFTALALISVSSSEKGQRLGDFFADTTVIKLINLETFSLGSILMLDKLKTYTPVYPDVIQFKEEEMLLIKETLERSVRYKNPKHNEALDKLVYKIESLLGVTAPDNKIAFLNTLIKDYVSITR
jgi:uncharacterized RDD family membrane protein YckC